MPTSDIKKGPLYVDSTNNRVGIGTTSPNSKLTVAGDVDANTGNLITNRANAAGASTAGSMQFQIDGTTYFTLTQPSSSALAFNGGGTERMRIDGATGNVGIGTTPSAKLHIEAGANNEAIRLNSSTGYNAGINYYVNNVIKWTAQALGDGTDAYRFYSFVNNSEAMRIKADGEINIGGDDYTDAHLNVLHNGGGNSGWQGAAIALYGSFGGKLSFVDNSDLAPSGSGYSLYTSDNGNDFYVQGNTNSTTNSGGVYLNDRATSWSSASDERQKENLVDITGALDDLATLRTVKGNYIWSPNQKKAFLIAQDVQAILPEAVSIQNKNDDAEDQRLGLDYNQMIPLLVAALNEAKTKIETLETNQAALETRIAALEAN